MWIISAAEEPKESGNVQWEAANQMQEAKRLMNATKNKAECG